MSNKTTDEKWQEVQTRVEQLVDRYLRGGSKATDRHPGNMGHSPKERAGYK